MALSATILHSEVDSPALQASLLKTVQWSCQTLGETIPLKIYHTGGETAPEGVEVIVYMKNAAWERLGQEADTTILEDFLQRGFVVITADFGDNPEAVSPGFDSDLHALFRAVYGYQSDWLLEGLGLTARKYRCFFLPAGYQLATDLVYWELDKHAVHGTLDYVLQSYNEDIVPKLPGLKPASTPSEMVDRYGQPFDWTIKMDIAYPSKAKRRVPTVVYSSTQSTRNPNAAAQSYVPHFSGFTTRGYAHVVMGHCFNPCVQHFFHFRKFTLDNWNAVNCYRAALRYLHANASKYGIDVDHIGVFGHSKGQQAVTILSNPHNALLEENLHFEGYPPGSPEPQPWPGYPSTIAAGYQSMGAGLWREEYLVPDYVPTLVACGAEERPVISEEGHPEFVHYLKEHDINFIELFMEGLGHAYPRGYDNQLGVDRYRLMHAFFDRYLLEDAGLPPVALLVSPRDEEKSVSPDTTVSVHFAPVIDPASVIDEKGVLLVPADSNNPVPGTWSVSRGGTLFTFKPAQSLESGMTYRILTTKGVRNLAGTHIDKQEITTFTVTTE